MNKLFAFGIGLLATHALWAETRPTPNDPLVLLLRGIYQPATDAPQTPFAGINLNDGNWIVTDIHSVTTAPGSLGASNTVVGKFYVNGATGQAVYTLPGGDIEMQFTAQSFPQTTVPDGQGGAYLEGTFELTVVDATGIFSAYKGGHNHMVDRFHLLANSQVDESCFCIISVPGGLALWWSLSN